MDLDHEPDTVLLAQAMRDNPTAGFLRNLGYEIVGISAGYDHIPEREADIDQTSGDLTELELIELQSSQADLWFHTQIDELWLNTLRNRTVAGMASVEQALGRERSSPRAVFVHVPLPHPPVVVNGACAARPSDSLTHPPFITDAALDPVDLVADASVALIGQQNECVDRLVQRAVTSVVDHDPTAVVIVMSDHGPDLRLNWGAPTDAAIRDRAANLFVARTPGHPRLFPDDVTLVNAMPMLLDAYFGAHLPLSSDDVYMQIPKPGGPLVSVTARAAP